MTFRTGLVAASMVSALAACLSGCVGEEPTPPAPKVVLVALNSTDSEVAGELSRRVLDHAGFAARVRRVAARELYAEPLSAGTAQVVVDYLSSSAEALNRTAHGQGAAPVGSADRATALRTLTGLARDRGLTALRPARAEGSTQYVVTPALADSLHLGTLSDLGRSGRAVSSAAFPDCVASRDCASGLERTYGIRLNRVEPLDGVATDALANGEADIAQVASTDPALDAGSLVVLRDDRSLQHAENLVPLVNSTWLAGHPRARPALERLCAVLTTADLRALVARVASGEQVETVARDYLTGKHLV